MYEFDFLTNRRDAEGAEEEKEENFLRLI